jgi:hypothetical protein
MHKYIYLAGDIVTLDNAQEQDDAADAIREMGLESVPVYEGGPEEQLETQYVMNANGIRYGYDQ